MLRCEWIIRSRLSGSFGGDRPRSGRVKAPRSGVTVDTSRVLGILYKCSHSCPEVKEFFFTSRSLPDEKHYDTTGRAYPSWIPEARRRPEEKRWAIGLSPAGSEHDRRPSALDEISTRIAWMCGSEDLPGWRSGHHRRFRYGAVEMAASRRQTRRTTVTGVQRAVTVLMRMVLVMLVMLVMLVFRAAVLVLSPAGRRADVGRLRRCWRGCMVHRSDQNAIRLGPNIHGSGRRRGVPRRRAVAVVDLLAVAPLVDRVWHGESELLPEPLLAPDYHRARLQ